MENKYIIFNVSEIDSIDFTQIKETSKDTLRKSNDETLTFVKYIGDMPSSIQSLTTKSQEYTNVEILEILNSDVWAVPTNHLISPME
jgi:hypothetical protein